MAISLERILAKLDSHLDKNDYDSAERHLLYWLSEAENEGDHRAELLIRNELMGLYRKINREKDALACVDAALYRIESLKIGCQVGAATTFLNCATVYKTFGDPEKAISLFERARTIYEAELDPKDKKLGGLYNNMALALVDCKRFGEAKELYEKAVKIMDTNESYLEVAITFLNMANAYESEFGLEEANELIEECLDKAEAILESWEDRNGYYAFVLDKCATVFGYYGRFFYEKEITERAARIYAGN